MSHKLNPHTTPHIYHSSWHTARAFANHNKTSVRQSTPGNQPSSTTDDRSEEATDSDVINFLKLPAAAPQFAVTRENTHLIGLIQSRASFAKAARRSLGSVLNLGGVLTIRPITALNLSDNFSSMFVKVRYDNRVYLSESADSKVTPVWTNEEALYSAYTRRGSLKKNRSTILSVHQQSSEQFNLPRENDINLNIMPFETSKSLRLTVIGETNNLQSKAEIGVLEIPLGSALECCAQSMEDYEEDINKLHPEGLPPAYVRWFPLMSPSDVLPMEGDLGKSTRPAESEKPRGESKCLIPTAFLCSLCPH